MDHMREYVDRTEISIRMHQASLLVLPEKELFNLVLLLLCDYDKLPLMINHVTSMLLANQIIQVK